MAQDETTGQPDKISSDNRPAQQPLPKPIHPLVASVSSADASPQTSRNASPSRREARPSLAGPFSTQPSAAAIQRALSAASVPQLHSNNSNNSVSDAVSKLPRAPKSASASAEATPTWPVSPRVKSPPPSGSSTSRRALAMSAANTRPAGGAADATPGSETSPPRNKPQDGDDSARKLDPPAQKSTPRGPSGKSVLETVQENSSDAIEPSPAAAQAANDLKPLTRITDADGKKDAADAERPAESGSESAGNKSDGKRGRRSSVGQSSASAQKAKASSAKPGYGTLSSAKSRQGEGKQAMTVETETVPSIPQSALNAGDRARSDATGSVRLKPSNETIRPKRDRKKPTPAKSRSITTGTASSKADIFEARVANAVDAEAHSSDSDDTFVYESNPPERQRTRRHHSRTPSVTSSHSTVDQRGQMRNFGEMLDDRRVAGKRSMKFSNHNNDFDAPDSRNGTVRSHRPRRQRGDADSSQATMEHDSPFTQASKLRNSTVNTRSRPQSPRSPTRAPYNALSGVFSRKAEQSFDFDGEGADDERTPLVPASIRSSRSARARRMQYHGGAFVQDLERNNNYSSSSSDRSRKWHGYMKGCCFGLVALVLAILFAVAVLVFWNRPLYDVDIRGIQHVLATEEKLILDLRVAAVNPNALGVTISDADLNVFAKSKHVGKSTGPALVVRRSLPEAASSPESASSQDLSHLWRATKNGKDHGTDPPDEGDLEPDTQTMLLGRVFHFDQALTFENSLWSRERTSAIGELSLPKPGNKTEIGGSKRWERVLQHPFDLIVRGTLKYRLPISSKAQSVAVEGSVTVHPGDGVDKAGNMRLTPVQHAQHWQWMEWPRDDEAA